MDIKQIINDLNKRALAEATGISYSKLRKYSSGAINKLTPDEMEKIYEYLTSIALYFKQ